MRYLGLISCLTFLAACGDSTGPSVEELLSHPVQFSVIFGDLQTDTIEAMLADPLMVRLTSQGDGQPIVGAMVNFRVMEDGCGSPFAGSALTDGAGEAAERWELGTRAGDCTMEARAVKPDGTPVVYDTMRATVEPGEPIYGWLLDGTSMGAYDTLPLFFGTTDTQDRGGNIVIWEPGMESGPGVIEYVQWAGSWWYIATEAGTGQMGFTNGGRTLFTADFSVCTEGERLNIMLYGPTVPMPDPPCPSG